MGDNFEINIHSIYIIVNYYYIGSWMLLLHWKPDNINTYYPTNNEYNWS